MSIVSHYVYTATPGYDTHKYCGFLVAKSVYPHKCYFFIILVSYKNNFNQLLLLLLVVFICRKYTFTNFCLNISCTHVYTLVIKSAASLKVRYYCSEHIMSKVFDVIT